jgi:hypothetical protein
VQEGTTVSTVRRISEKQLEANRRNASQSTGPKTEAGKQASRMNAVTHGLLAKAVVITAGDYQEDEQEFGQLLEDLREQFGPVGVAEDLEVQKIALCYWRKMRAVRYEHGAIRQRTGDMREREKLSHEKSFDFALGCGANLEQTARGIQYLIDYLEWVKQEVLDGPLSAESQEWLEEHFLDEFAPPDETLDDETLLAEPTEAGPGVTEDERRQRVATIDEQLRRLSRLREKVAAMEELNLDSKLRAAALPGPGAVDKLVRYETSNDRELDRVLKRLERMQERRRATGGSDPKN